MDISTPSRLGVAVKEARLDSGLTQQQLAVEAKVSRKLIVELEAGHARAELGKAMQVLAALGLGASAASSRLQRELQTLIDKTIPTIAAEITNSDYDFALRLAIDMFTAARDLIGELDSPFLRRPDPTGDGNVDTLILAALRWALGSDLGDIRPWPAPKPLSAPWYAYEFRGLSDAWKELSMKETPQGLAAANILIRERSLVSA